MTAYWCQVQLACCTGRAVHQHHRRMRSQGGTNDECNLLSVCIPCHDHIHGHPRESYRNGWLVASWDDPHLIDPVLADGAPTW